MITTIWSDIWKTKEEYRAEWLKTYWKKTKKPKKVNQSAIELGEKLRFIRVSRGVSQQKLAMQVDSAQCEISRIENGEQLPQLSTLEKLSKILDFSITIELNPK